MKKFLLTLLVAFASPWAANSWMSNPKSLSAVDSALTVVARGYNSVSYQITGTWSATVKFEGTVNGSNWITVYAVNQNGGAVDSVATANGVYLLSGNGFLSIRARVSARSSGTTVVQATTNEGSGVVSLLNQSSAGASSNVAVTTSALPTGAATAAAQTGGSQKTQLVDGSNNVISATSNALDVNIKSGAASGAVAQGSTTSGQTGGLTQAAVTTAAPTYTTGQTSPLSLNTSGGMRVDPSGVTSPVSLASVPSHAVTNAGTFSVQETSAASDPFGVNADGASATGSISAKLRFIASTGIPVTSSALPTGAATAAKQPALGTAGASSADVISVQGIASGTAMPVSAASLPLPASASTSTKQSDGSQKTQIVDGSGNVIASTSNNLNVQCANCSGSGVSAADEATFTPGTSLFASGGGLYQVTQTSNPLTTGQQGAFQTTRFRALHVTLRDSTGAVFGTAAVPVRTDPTGTTTQPVSIATAPALVASSAVIGKVGIDQTTPGTTNLVALAANQSVNVAQINGVTPLMGNGVTGTGSPRVTIASDNTAFTVNAAESGTWNITNVSGTVSLPTGAATAAKQPALGTAGSASTDVISVQGIASMTPFLANPGTAANWGVGATGSAVPANAVYHGAVSSGNLVGLIQADASAKIDVSTATTTQLVALSSGKKIYVTTWDVVAAGTGTLKLVYGTGSSCGTGTTDLTGAYSLVAQAGISKGGGLGPVLVVPASNALCVTTSAAVGMQGSVAYTQF